MSNLELGDDEHPRQHGHTHRAQEMLTDVLHDLRMRVAYDRLTSALQVISAQFILLMTDTSPVLDPRESIDAGGFLLSEAKEELSELRCAPRDRERYRSLTDCLTALELLNSSLHGKGSSLSGVRARATFVQGVRDVAARLARAANHEQGLNFFGSGGCGDIEHRFLHI